MKSFMLSQVMTYDWKLSDVACSTTTIRPDFCLIPIGTGEPSVAEYIAEVLLETHYVQGNVLTYDLCGSVTGS